MPADKPIHLILFVWLLVCAIQDWRSREVSNWLTLPALALAFSLRLFGIIRAPIIPLLVEAALLLLAWHSGWIGGADVKGSLTLALLDPRYLFFAWTGNIGWYVVLRLYLYHRSDQRIPAFVGFAAGVASLLIYQTLPQREIWPY
jgi:Flp pilus assembly protein protease CpaA